MGIGGIMFLLGLIEVAPPIVAGIGFLVGVIGWLVRGHVNVLLE